MNTETNQVPWLPTPVEVSQLLPSDARKLLTDASRIPDAGTRAKRVDLAMEIARQRYPSMFKAE